MTRASSLMVCLFGISYLTATLASANAATHGHGGYAAVFLIASIVLLAAAHRELHHSARLLRTVAVYRHGQMSGPLRDAIDDATALPPECTCDTWWTSLGEQHAPACPAHVWENSP
ncbi:hypothetical protein [Streptomyces sp. HPF1205]|uniref:hypothetical protein n=1 Tax=Streptomyces sp. HPF1205 TaxID=2873262 RepID=UPI001CED9EE9|nr:hypothetical protein [Streptomyces sp. HPF1205]